MKQRNVFLALLLFSFATSLKAQNCDPWIKQSYNLLYKRNPTTAECNIKNYNNGSWGSLAELIGYVEGFNRNKPGDFIKGDPWIFKAYYELYSRIPNPIELNVTLYNGGSWNNYGELKNYISQFQNSLSQNGVKLLAGKANGKDAAAMTDDHNNLIAVSLVTPNGGLVIAPGGGNVISAGGGNVVSAGGDNFNFNSNTPGLNITGGYSTQSAGAKKIIKTAGKGTIVIR